MKSKLFYAAVFGLALGLRVWGLWGPMWYDEAFTVSVARLAQPGFVEALAGDVHPPLYYALMGGGLWMIRAASAALSMWAMLGLYMLLGEMGWPERGRALALSMMAVSPFQVFFAQEARMYALLEWAVVLGMWGVWKRERLVLALAGVVMVYTSQYGWFYWAALLGCSVWRQWKGVACCVLREWVRLGVVFAAPVAAYAPWAMVTLSQAQTIRGGYWIQPVRVGGVMEIVYYLFLGFSAPAWMFVWGAVLLYAVIGWAAWRWIRAERRPEGWEMLAIMAGVPGLLALGVSLVWQPVLLFRGLIGSTPALYALLAWPLSRLRRLEGVYIGAMGVVIVGATLGNYYLHSPRAGGIEAVRAAIGEIRAQGSGDTVYHLTSGSMLVWGIEGEGLRQVKVPTCGEYEAWGGMSAETQRGLGIVEGTPRAGEHAWLVVSLGPLHNGCYDGVMRGLLRGARLVRRVAGPSGLQETSVWELGVKVREVGQ